MCDDAAFDDMVKYELRNGGLSRRELGALAMGAGFALALPRTANALETKGSEVDIETPLAGVMTRSRIDAVFPDPRPGTTPGQVVVVDWKTGREPTDPAAVLASVLSGVRASHP